MPHFFDLPRELRDMIYLAVITWSRPRPQLTGTTTRCLFFEPSNEASSPSHSGPSGSKPPTTSCANLLATNRQVHAEMVHAVARARRKGLLVARLDYANGDGFYHAFQWLGVPIVRTSTVQLHPLPKQTAGWKRNVPVVRHLFAAQSLKKLATCWCTATTVEQLQIDVRLLGQQPGSLDNAIMWAICDTLKGLVGTKGTAGNCANEVTIDTLILNVVTAAQSGVLTEALVGDATRIFDDDSQAVAKSLLDIWNKLWSGVEYLNGTYCILLERIQRVKVCIDGVLIRERELRLELERGQAERKRIALRVGW